MSTEYLIQDQILNHEFRLKYTWRDWYLNDVPKDVDIPGLGVVNVETRGGGYDDDSFLILRVDMPTGETRYYKKIIYNSSFGGTDDYGPFNEVFPQERIVKEFN